MASSIFVVQTGRLRLERHLADGTAVTLAVLGPGDTIAEAALFAETYHCDASAEIRSKIWLFPKKEVEAGLARDPEALMDWARSLAAQIRRLRALLEIRSIKRADARVLSYLDLLDALGEAWSGDRPVSAVAAELGLTPEALYRTLTRLEEREQIRRAGRAIERRT